MAAESTRHPREEPFLPGDRDEAEGTDAGSGGGETLAEKIHRYRRAGGGGSSGGGPGSGSRVVRHPREE